MKKFRNFEIWFAIFPYEDNPNTTDEHPVLIINCLDHIEVIGLMVTGSAVRDEYDIEMRDWKQAGLQKKSVIRTRRRYKLSEANFRRKIGNLSEQDQLLLKFRLTE